jgi:zinc protease
LTKGTSRKGASQIAEWVESRGGRLEVFSGRDGFGLILQVLASDAAEGLDLVHEFVTDAAFPEAELELQRQLTLKALTVRDDDVFDVGSRLLRQTLFASHPYRFDPLGTTETVSRLTRRDCQAFAAQWLVPGNLVLTISGDVQPAAVLEQVRRRFAPLPKTPSPWPQTLPAEPLDRVREASRTVSKEQCVIFLGFRGAQVTAKDRDALDVLTAALSGMSGRLFQAVREEQGLAYTLGALNVPGWDRGYLAVYAATKPGERAKVLHTIETQLQALIDTGVTADEVEQAKRYLIGAHRMDLQQLAGVARQCALDELYGLGYEAWRSYEPRLNAITPQMVQEAAKRYLTLSQRAEVVVGPLVEEPVPAQP